MAHPSIALFDHLRRHDASTREQLEQSLEGSDLATARARAKDEPDNAQALAQWLGQMVLEGTAAQEVIDAAKFAAARAPRDDAGNEVALVAGIVIWRLCGTPQLAEPYVRRSRRTDPGNPALLEFYRELFGDEAGTAQLLQVLVQARRGSKDPEQRFALAQEVADLAEQRQGSLDRAIEVWRSVIREDGWDPRASAALERLYRQAGKWTALVDLLKDESERMGEGPEASDGRIAKLLEIAELYRDRLKLDTMALGTLTRILEVDPHHEPTLEALAQTYAKAGRANDLLAVYQRRIDGAQRQGDQARQVELLRRMAEIWLDELGNPQRALEPLQQVLQLDPRDRPARDLLARIHEQRRDFRGLIALRREDLTELHGDQALALRLELAHVAEERLGDRNEAIAAYNDVIAHHGDQADALAALARIYERESRWPAAAEVLHRQVAAAQPDTVIDLLVHLGGIYTDRLHDQDNGVAVWSEVLRLRPGHERAIRRLRDAHVAAGRWDALQALYAGQGRMDEVVDVLQNAADRLSDIGERVALYRRVAALCQGQLGQPERAQRALERTLAIAPDNLDVARDLLPIYREQHNWARLLATYEILLRAAGNDDERLDLIGAMGEVAAHQLSSPALTLRWAAAAYAIRPPDPGLREALEQAAEQAEGWDELSKLFEARIQDGSVADDERLVLLHKLAKIAAEKLSKPDDAQRHYRRIIALDPGNEMALSALEAIYTSTRRWEDLAEVYHHRLQAKHDESSQLATLQALARLQEHQLGDIDAAVQAYSQILELRPEDAHALERLIRLHRNRGDWPALVIMLERKLEAERHPQRRVSLMFELAEIYGARLADPARAIAGFLGVLELASDHAGAVTSLEALRTSEPASAVTIMTGLLPYYRRVGDRRREAEALEVLVAAEPDATARLGLHEQLAAIYETMEDRREDAMRIRVELFRAEPSQWQGRQTLARLGLELGRPEEVANAYRQTLADLAEEAQSWEARGTGLPKERATLRRDLLLEFGAWLRDKLGRPIEAQTIYAEVLEQEETHQAAYEALEALLRASESYAELRDLYRRRADVTFQVQEQRQLLTRIIDLSAQVLHDIPAAKATAEELLDLIPDDVAVVERLAQMYTDAPEPGDDAKLEALLGRWAELETDPQRVRVLQVQRASLRMGPLEDPSGAVDVLGQVVGEDPTDAAARVLLESLLEHPRVQAQVCALLEPVYLRLHDHEGRIRILQVRRDEASAQSNQDQAITYMLQIAKIRQVDQGDGDGAFAVVRQAYLADPRRADARAELERLGQAYGRYAELVEIWRTALDGSAGDDLNLRIELMGRIADVLDERLHDAQGATWAWNELLALEPPDVKLAQRAALALCRLHLEAGDGVALIEAKRQLLRFVGEPEQHLQIRLEIADIQEQLGDSEGAVQTYREVLDLAPGNVPALEALERLFLASQSWESLCEILERRIRVTQDARLKASMWRQLGEITRDQLHDVPRALAAFQSILELKVAREETIHALTAVVALNEQLERWADVDEGLRRMIGLADLDVVRLELLTRIAMNAGRHLGRTADALDGLKRVLDVMPQHARARAEVLSYLEREEGRDRAIRILMPLYEAEQDWPEYLALEELQARHQPSGRRRLEALVRVANTLESRLNDADRAFDVLCAAMGEAADQPELAELLERVERLGADPARAEALLQAYENTVDHILDSELQQRVLRAMGEVALVTLGRLDAARTSYERVLSLAPNDDAAAEALERIYVAQGDYEALAQLLSVRADRAVAPHRRDVFLMRAAELTASQLDRPDESIRLYERLSADALASPQVQDALEPLYEATQRWRELTVHIARKLPHLGPKEAVEAHLRLGRIYGEKLDDADSGIRHMSTALRLDPEHAVGTEELGRYLSDPNMRHRVAGMLEPVFAAVGDWRRLLQIQEIRLEEAPDEGARTRILLRMAQIEEEQLEDLERAFESYTRLLRERPGNRYVREQLARLARLLGQTARYAELLTEYVSGTGADDNSDEMLALVREAAQLWAGSLRQPARAVPLWRRLWAAAPGDASLFASLESALTQAELWRDLAEFYWTEAENHEDFDRQIELLRKIALLAQEMLEEPAEAIRAYQRMIELRPNYDMARARLEQLLEDTERWAELIQLLHHRMERAGVAADRARLGLRMAHIQADKLQDSAAAIDLLEAGLSAGTAQGETIVLLERLAEASPEHRERIYALLHPVYVRSGEYGRLVAIETWYLSQTDEPAQRHDHLFAIIGWFEKAGQVQQAFEQALAALAEPGYPAELVRLDDELRRLSLILSAQARLAQALVAAAADPRMDSDEERRVALWYWAAELHQELGDGAAAADDLRHAIAIDPDHLPSLTLLDSVLQGLGDQEGLATVLRQRAILALDDQTRLELLHRLGLLLEDGLANRDAAEPIWREIRTIDAADATALERLAQAYEARGAVLELMEVTQGQIDNCEQDDQRRALRLKLAALHRRQADRAAEVEELRTLLEEQPEDREALALLTDALLHEQRYEEAVEVLDQRARLAPDNAARAQWWLQAARLWSGLLGNGAQALTLYPGILECDPEMEGALSDLIDLSEEEGTHAVAAHLVLPRLEQLGRDRSVARVWAARAQFALDPQSRAEALDNLARIHLERLNDPAGARGAWNAVLELRDLGVGPRLEEALEQGTRVALRIAQGAAQIDFLEDRVRDPDREPAVRLAIARFTAKVCEEQLGEGARGLALLLGLVQSSLADVALCETTAAMAVRCGDLQAAVTALGEAVALSSEPQDQASLRVRLGDLQRERGEREGALEAYRDAFELAQAPGALAGLEELQREDPRASAVLDALEHAYQVREDRVGQARIVRARLEAGGFDDRRQLLDQLGVLCDQGGGTAEQALEAWGELLALDSDNTTAAARVFALAEAGLLEVGANVLRAAIAAARARGELPTQLMGQTAALLLGEVGDRSGALGLVHGLLDADPEDQEALELGIRAARALANHGALHEFLGRAAALRPDPEGAAALWAEAATVAERDLQRPDLAIEDLRQQLAAVDDDPAVWTRLTDLLTARGAYAELAEALGQQVMVTGDPELRRSLRLRLAALWVDRLERPDEGVVVLREAQIDDPDDPRVAGELDTLLRRLGRWRDVHENLVHQLDTAELHEKIGILEELARVAEVQLQDWPDAIQRYQEIIALDPEHALAQVALDRLLAQQERYAELAELREGLMQTYRRQGAQQAYREMAASLAALLADKLGELERAQVILDELLAQDPQDVGALVALAALHDAQGDPAASREVLLRAATLDPQGPHGAEVHFRLANLAPESPQAQIEHLHAAFRLHPEHPGVADALEKACREGQRWQDLATLLEHLEARQRDPEVRRALALERIDLWLGVLDDPEAALAALEPLYQQIQDDAEINRRIADGLMLTGRAEEAEQMYEWLVDVGRQGKRSRTLAHDLTRLARLRLERDRADEARELLLEAYRADTTHVETMLGLATLWEREGNWPEVLKIYRTMLLQNADTSGLLRRGDLYLGLGRAHLALGESAKSKAMVRRGLEEDAEHEGLRQLLGELGG